MRRYKSILQLGLGSLVILLVAAACTSNNDEAEDPVASATAPEGSAVTRPAAVPGIDFAAPSGITGGDAEFNYSALVWQGYWLSRDNFGPFVMASGAGIPFEPPMDMLQMAIQMVAQNPADGVMIPQNMVPLQAVFASASPKLVNDPRNFDPMDFQGLRLDSATFDRTVRVRAQAETMLKESQWAHNFADAHFGDPKGDFGAQQRFMGVMVNMIAQMQGQYAMQSLLRADGLYYDSDGKLDYTGNWVMLHTLSDLAGLASAGRYENPEMAAPFSMAAANLSTTLATRIPADPEESAAAVRALLYLVSTTSDNAMKEAASKKATSVADGLVSLSSADVVANSAAISGLISQSVASDQTKYRDSADSLFKKLQADFDSSNGVFKSKSTYSADDIAWIVGGLNSLVQHGNEVTKGPATRMLVAFYESTISMGGLQLSAPPGQDGAMAGAFEKKLPSVVYYHPAKTPAPPASGYLTVTAAEIAWDGKNWTMTSDRFDTAGAMHLANELNWLGPHLGSIPFPITQSQAPVSTPAANSTPAAAPTGAQSLTAKNVSFDKTALVAAAGQETTITFTNQDQSVPHNLHVQAGAAGDFKTEIKAGPSEQLLTFTITQPGTYNFICDVHPAEMKGTITIK